MWNHRLHHPSALILNEVLLHCNVPFDNKNSIDFHNACCLGKIHKFPFPSSQSIHNRPLELIHIDLCGPSPVISSNGYKYHVCFVDVESIYSKINMMSIKLSLISRLKLSCNLGFLLSLFNPMVVANIKLCLISFEPLELFVTYQFPHTHQQNGLAKRKHRHIIEKTLTFFLFTLIEKASYSHPPDYINPKVFCCSCFPNLKPFKKHKL